MEDNVYQLEVKRANVVLGSGQEINETIWGTIIGDISRQKDLQTELDNIKGSIPDITKINQDINLSLIHIYKASLATYYQTLFNIGVSFFIALLECKLLTALSKFCLLYTSRFV